MKLLFDENLSPRLAQSVADLFPGSRHVFELFAAGATDNLIWDHALANDSAIVSRDSDFADRSALEKNAPKIIWIRVGNCSSREIEVLLRINQEAIRGHLRQANDRCLSLTRS